jgi:hypothetical protein
LISCAEVYHSKFSPELAAWIDASEAAPLKSKCKP